MHGNITYTHFLIACGAIILLGCIIYFIRKYGINFLEELNRESVRYEEKLRWREIANKRDQKEDPLAQLEIIVNDIRTNVLAKAGRSVPKQQLLNAIAERVPNYGGLHQPAYRYALNNFIIQHSKILCGAEIREEELEELWNDLPH